jgi:sulfocyanin
MKRFLYTGLAGILSFGLLACGGGEADSGSASPAPAPAPAAAPPAAAPAGGVSAADWITVNADARTVTINLIAGETAENNRWNFNGFANGDATVVVPEGFAVTINFSNEDPANMHSVAVLDGVSGTPPVMYNDVSPVFAGAITSNATSMTEATASGQSETITFTAGAAGSYSLICLIPAHAATGMWIGFEVSASGESGLKM